MYKPKLQLKDISFESSENDHNIYSPYFTSNEEQFSQSNDSYFENSILEQEDNDGSVVIRKDNSDALSSSSSYESSDETLNNS